MVERPSPLFRRKELRWDKQRCYVTVVVVVLAIGPEIASNVANPTPKRWLNYVRDAVRVIALNVENPGRK